MTRKEAGARTPHIAYRQVGGRSGCCAGCCRGCDGACRSRGLRGVSDGHDRRGGGRQVRREGDVLHQHKDAAAVPSGDPGVLRIHPQPRQDYLNKPASGRRGCMAGISHHSSSEAACCSADTLTKGCCFGSLGARALCRGEGYLVETGVDEPCLGMTLVQSAEGQAYLVKVGVNEPGLGAVIGDGELQVGLLGDQARQLMNHTLRRILRRPQRILRKDCI